MQKTGVQACAKTRRQSQVPQRGEDEAREMYMMTQKNTPGNKKPMLFATSITNMVEKRAGINASQKSTL